MDWRKVKVLEVTQYMKTLCIRHTMTELLPKWSALSQIRCRYKRVNATCWLHVVSSQHS